VVAGDELAARSGLEGLKISGHRVRLFRDSLDVMGWNPVGRGLQVVFSRRIPSIVRRFAREEYESLLEAAGVDGGAVTAFLGHPGGPKVLDAYEEALGWEPGRFRLAREVFEDWGNLSSASILHVLEKALDEGACGPGEHVLLAALGPGFTSEQLLAVPH
jgi:alkylresorcinol/alkylpyrone synthase